MNRAGLLCLVLIAVAAAAQTTSTPNSPAKPSPSSQVPAIDGAIGPCFLELTVLDTDSKPVYDATVKVHIPYGMGGFHHLDLQAGTNADGKVKFTGLPIKVHHPPLEFDATKEPLVGSLNYDPATECHAHHQIKLEKPKPEGQQQ